MAWVRCSGGGKEPFNINNLKHAEATRGTKGTVSVQITLDANKEYILVGNGSGNSAETYHGSNWSMSGSMNIPNTATILDTVISNNVTYTATYGATQDHGGYSEHVYRVKTSAPTTITYSVSASSSYTECSSSATLVAIPV